MWRGTAPGALCPSALTTVAGHHHEQSSAQQGQAGWMDLDHMNQMQSSRQGMHACPCQQRQVSSNAAMPMGGKDHSRLACSLSLASSAAQHRHAAVAARRAAMQPRPCRFLPMQAPVFNAVLFSLHCRASGRHAPAAWCTNQSAAAHVLHVVRLFLLAIHLYMQAEACRMLRGRCSAADGPTRCMIETACLQWRTPAAHSPGLNTQHDSQQTQQTRG